MFYGSAKAEAYRGKRGGSTFCQDFRSFLF